MKNEGTRFRMIDPSTFGLPDVNAPRRIDPVALQPALLRDLRGKTFPLSLGRFSPGVRFENEAGDPTAVPESGPRNETGK